MGGKRNNYIEMFGYFTEQSIFVTCFSLALIRGIVHINVRCSAVKHLLLKLQCQI